MKEIQLTRGLVSLVDDADYERFCHIKWAATNTHYAVGYPSGIANGQAKLHRLILGAIPGETVDHINGNPLDNRRANLRLVTHAQNLWNSAPMTTNKKRTSSYRGVWQQKGRYCARITCHHKRTFLGFFDTEKDAALAYDSKARELYGVYARLNFPDQCENPTRQQRKQCSNTSKYTAFGETLSITEWSNHPRCIVKWRTLRARLDRGWDIIRALTTSV